MFRVIYKPTKLVRTRFNMTQPGSDLFPKMFECICRGSGITLEEGVAMLNKHFAVRGWNDDLTKTTKPQEVVPDVQEAVKAKTKPKTQPKKPKYEKPNVILPWTGKSVDTWCQGIRVNHQLLSQCTMKPKKDGFCTTCLKQVQEKGQPKCGTVAMRIEADKQKKTFKNPENGKEPVKFADVMNKLKITKEAAVAEASKFGLTIPEEEFVVTEKKKGRPKKQKSEDTLTAIINEVVAASSSDSSSSEFEGDSEPVKEPSPEPVKEPAPEAVQQKELAIEEYDEDYDAETDDEEVNVVCWTFDGKQYLKDENNIVYDVETHEAIGVFCEKEEKIIPNCAEASSDEEEFD